MGVDPDVACLYLLGDTGGFSDVIRPHGGSEPHGGVISPINHVLFILPRQKRNDRAYGRINILR